MSAGASYQFATVFPNVPEAGGNRYTYPLGIILGTLFGRLFIPAVKCFLALIRLPNGSSLPGLTRLVLVAGRGIAIWGGIKSPCGLSLPTGPFLTPQVHSQHTTADDSFFMPMKMTGAHEWPSQMTSAKNFKLG